MKIVLINTSERTGGAGIACNRLMKALNKCGHNAKMLVRDKQTDDENVVSINDSWFAKKKNAFRFLWERLVILLQNGFNRKDLFAVSIANTGTDISSHPVVEEADIIHLHWINQGMLSLKNIRQLIRTGKPIVWTLHDMWPLTGICHHARECGHFSKACGNCFFLNSTKEKDLSRNIFVKKRNIYASNITFVACSSWLNKKAQLSSLPDKEKITVIPNPVDIETFTVADKSVAREKLSLPANKKLILFGALNVADKRKGIAYLIQAINSIQRRFPEFYKSLELVVFGQAKSDVVSMINVPVHSMGYLREEQEIRMLYDAVDLFVTASLEENLPNTIMEAMACGVPCAGFDVGGIPEMIEHKQNGYVAEYKNPEDLAAGIRWVLSDADYAMLSANARQKVEQKYAEEIVAQHYVELYADLLNQL